MSNAGCSEQQISSFTTKSNTLAAFKSLLWFVYPVVGLVSQFFFEWDLLVNPGKLNNSVWIGHQTSIVKTLTRIMVIVCIFGICVLPYHYFDKRFGEACLLAATVVWVGFLRGFFNWLKLDNGQS